MGSKYGNFQNYQQCNAIWPCKKLVPVLCLKFKSTSNKPRISVHHWGNIMNLENSKYYMISGSTSTVVDPIINKIYGKMFHHKRYRKNLRGHQGFCPNSYDYQVFLRNPYNQACYLKYFCETGSSPRFRIQSHSLVCIKHYLFIVGIRPILNKELDFIYWSDCSDLMHIYS